MLQWASWSRSVFPLWSGIVGGAGFSGASFGKKADMERPPRPYLPQPRTLPTQPDRDVATITPRSPGMVLRPSRRRTPSPLEHNPMSATPREMDAVVVRPIASSSPVRSNVLAVVNDRVLHQDLGGSGPLTPNTIGVRRHLVSDDSVTKSPHAFGRGSANDLSNRASQAGSADDIGMVLDYAHEQAEGAAMAAVVAARAAAMAAEAAAAASRPREPQHHASSERHMVGSPERTLVSSFAGRSGNVSPVNLRSGNVSPAHPGSGYAAGSISVPLPSSCTPRTVASPQRPTVRSASVRPNTVDHTTTVISPRLHNGASTHRVAVEPVDCRLSHRIARVQEAVLKDFRPDRHEPEVYHPISDLKVNFGETDLCVHRRIAELGGALSELSEEVQAQARRADLADARLRELRAQGQQDHRGYQQVELQLQAVAASCHALATASDDGQQLLSQRVHALEEQLHERLENQDYAGWRARAEEHEVRLATLRSKVEGQESAREAFEQRIYKDWELKREQMWKTVQDAANHEVDNSERLEAITRRVGLTERSVEDFCENHAQQIMRRMQESMSGDGNERSESGEAVSSRVDELSKRVTALTERLAQRELEFAKLSEHLPISQRLQELRNGGEVRSGADGAVHRWPARGRAESELEGGGAMIVRGRLESEFERDDDIVKRLATIEVTIVFLRGQLDALRANQSLVLLPGLPGSTTDVPATLHPGSHHGSPGSRNLLSSGACGHSVCDVHGGMSEDLHGKVEGMDRVGEGPWSARGGGSVPLSEGLSNPGSSKAAFHVGKHGLFADGYWSPWSSPPRETE